jgi:hypothetical protein
MVFVVISLFALLILLIWVFSLLILVRFARGLTILFIFSKSQLFVSLILCVGFCLFVSVSGDVDCYLTYFRQWLITHLLSALLSFQPLFTESSCGVQLPCSSPLLWCTYSTVPPLLCVHLQFLAYCSVGFFFVGWGFSLPRELRWFIPGVAVGIPHDAWFSPVGLLDVSQAGLELASGGTGALLFSQ